MVVLVDMIDSITQFDTHQAIPTKILTKCIVLVVEKLVVVKLNPPLDPRSRNLGYLLGQILILT